MITLRTLVCAGLCASLFSACQNDKRLPGSPVEYFGSVMPITGTEVLESHRRTGFGGFRTVPGVEGRRYFGRSEGQHSESAAAERQRAGRSTANVGFLSIRRRENYGRRKQQALCDRNLVKRRFRPAFFPCSERIRSLYFSRRGRPVRYLHGMCRRRNVPVL